jgi:hypothetical protein
MPTSALGIFLCLGLIWRLEESIIKPWPPSSSHSPKDGAQVPAGSQKMLKCSIRLLLRGGCFT